MPADPVRNFAKVLVVGLYDESATIIQLASGELSKLPDPLTDGQFNLVWWNATDYADPADDPYKEIVRVIARDVANNTITVIRGQENTVAQPHNIPNKVYKMMLALTQKTYEDLQKIEVFQGSTLVGFRNKLSFVSPLVAEDDSINQLIRIRYSGNFGGDGSDGDLIISSGTTTIDLQNQKIFVKNYNNLKITGTASLNFINPHDEGTLIIFKVKNDCEITSTANPVIDLRLLGSASNMAFLPSMKTRVGAFIRYPNEIGGQGGCSAVNSLVNFYFDVYTNFDFYSGAYSAPGGRGGGGLLIEVGGNFTGNPSSVINAAGQNGQSNSGNATISGTGATGYYFVLPPNPPFTSGLEKTRFFLPLPGAGGITRTIYNGSGTKYGGGGGGGSVLILVNGTISGSLTFNVSGGTTPYGGETNGADGIGLILPNKWFA